MKCIAIDDEPVALGIIRQFCQRSGDIELITFTDPVEGLQKVKDMHPDLVFLDIEMGGFNGIDIARQLPAGTFLIFTTAYAEFAVDGFDLDAIDFLHKPFSYNRFERAVEKVKRLQELQRLQAKPVFADEEITLKVEYKNVKIRLADIEYIEAMDNYIRIILTSDKPILSQTSMKTVMELLPAERFMRIHKSYIVPLHKIASYNRRQLTLHHRNVELPIGRVYADEFMKRMNLLPIKDVLHKNL